MRSGKILRMGLGAICLAGVLAFAISAGAASYVLDTGNGTAGTVSGYAGPFGTVNITLTDSTHAAVTYTAGSAGGFNFLFVDGGSVALNVNGAVTIQGGLAGITATQPAGFQPYSLTLTGGQNEDGFGQFNFELDNFDSFAHAMTSLSFTLVKTSGTWSSDTDVLMAGNAVAAHIAVAGGDYSALPGGPTGYALGTLDTTGHDLLPDGGSTVALLGFAFLGIGALRHRLSRN